MVGQQVNHFLIEAELGQGGMGVVYRALDTKLGRTVALKFLPPMFSKDESAKARFTNEARAVSALDHPNIAVVHEIGETEKGEMYIAMAFYEGRTLEDIISEGVLPLEDVVSYSLDMARGLGAAHAKGIIHRDIKPGNIMVTDSGFLKILDFGLAKVQDVTMTMVAMSLGTLAYMSPEQARGTGVDHRTDLWALGVVMYEMLTGKRPFDGPYDAAILYAAANTDHDSVTLWRDDAPDHLAGIIDRLLQKEPEKRYQDAEALIADMEAMRAPTPSMISPAVSGVQPAVEAPEPTSDVPFWKRPAVLLGAVALVVFGVAGSWYVSGLGAPDAPPITEAERQQARDYLRSGQVKYGKGSYNLALVDFERAVELDSTYAPAWASISGVYLQLNDPTGAVREARRAIGLDSTMALAYYNLGLALADMDSIEASLEALVHATQIEPGFTAAYSARGDILIEDGRPSDALEVLRVGLENTPVGADMRFIIYKNLGKAYLVLEDNQRAIDNLMASQRLNPEWTETAQLLARTFDRIGERDLARQQWQKYLDLEKEDLEGRAEARRQLGQ